MHGNQELLLIYHIYYSLSTKSLHYLSACQVGSFGLNEAQLNLLFKLYMAIVCFYNLFSHFIAQIIRVRAVFVGIILP
jgi:hypothetical protein